MAPPAGLRALVPEPRRRSGEWAVPTLKDRAVATHGPAAYRLRNVPDRHRSSTQAAYSSRPIALMLAFPPVVAANRRTGSDAGTERHHLDGHDLLEALPASNIGIVALTTTSRRKPYAISPRG